MATPNGLKVPSTKTGNAVKVVKGSGAYKHATFPSRTAPAPAPYKQPAKKMKYGKK